MDILGYISSELTGLNPAQKRAMLEDFTDYFGYQEEIEGKPNPQSRKEFGNKHIKRFIRSRVNSVRKARAEASVIWEKLNIGD